MKRRYISLFLCFILIVSCFVPVAMPTFAISNTQTEVYYDDKAIASIEIPSNGTIDINVAEGSYDELQWQINIPESKTWVSIYNENTSCFCFVNSS